MIDIDTFFPGSIQETEQWDGRENFSFWLNKDLSFETLNQVGASCGQEKQSKLTVSAGN